MDEYAALAQRVAVTLDDVRGCLVLSRDGLVLGAFPEESEASMKPAWLRFVNVGDARRSFVEFGDETWAYIFRGPYAAFVVAGTAVRPGVLLDQLEMALLTAEESRQKRDTLRVPEAPGAPSGKPRTSLHPPTLSDRPPADVAASAPNRAFDAFTNALGARPASGKPLEATPTSSPLAEPVHADDDRSPVQGQELDTTPAGPEPFRPSPFADLEGVAEPVEGPTADGPPSEEPTAVEHPTAEPSSFPRVPQKLVGGAPTPEGESEIDRVLLAKEFGGLLQGESDGDEASS